MDSVVNLESTFIPSEDVVAREISGELIIVPLAAGIGDMQDELFSLNGTGRAIWEQLDGTKNLKTVVQSLSAEFDAPANEIESDVIGLVEELAKRGIVVEKSRG